MAGRLHNLETGSLRAKRQHPRKLLLACLGGLVLAGSCGMPKPPLPSRLVLTSPAGPSQAAVDTVDAL